MYCIVSARDKKRARDKKAKLMSTRPVVEILLEPGSRNEAWIARAR